MRTSRRFFPTDKAKLTMSKKEKKSFDTNTPEWQILENLKSNKMLVGNYIKDAERFTAMAETARKKYESYLAAMIKLVPDFNEEDY